MAGIGQRCCCVGTHVLAACPMLASAAMLSRYAEGHVLYVHAVLYIGGWGGLCALMRALVLLLPGEPSIQKWMFAKTRMWVVLGSYFTALVFVILGMRILYEALSMVSRYGYPFDGGSVWYCAACCAIAAGVLYLRRTISP